ncbi:hypothetical protein DSUL_50442 [Desulfovibrionales bacterium]
MYHMYACNFKTYLDLDIRTGLFLQGDYRKIKLIHLVYTLLSTLPLLRR